LDGSSTICAFAQEPIGLRSRVPNGSAGADAL